jgi:hypothetical protein
MRRLATPLIATLGAVLVISCASSGGGRAGATDPAREAAGLDQEMFFARGQAEPYTKPRTKEPQCVQKAVRIPRSLEGYVSKPLTVKFAVLSDGRVDRFSMLTPEIPDEITVLVKDAVESCRWTPGTDATGHPVAIWILLPLHFHAG